MRLSLVESHKCAASMRMGGGGEVHLDNALSLPMVPATGIASSQPTACWKEMLGTRKEKYQPLAPAYPCTPYV